MLRWFFSLSLSLPPCLGEHENDKNFVLFSVDQTLVLEDGTGLHEAELCVYDQARRQISDHILWHTCGSVQNIGWHRLMSNDSWTLLITFSTCIVMVMMTMMVIIMFHGPFSPVDYYLLNEKLYAKLYLTYVDIYPFLCSLVWHTHLPIMQLNSLTMEFLYEIGQCWNFNMPCSQMDTVFWRCLLLPLSGWKSSPVLKMEAVCSSKTLRLPYQTTWRHIPEDHNLNCHISVLYISVLLFLDLISRKQYSNRQVKSLPCNTLY
jgi:hypothetical protein